MDDDRPLPAGSDEVLYDFLKHLTSLCLFALGGVLALADKVQGKSARSLVIAVGVIALAAFCSFIATSIIVEARSSGKPPSSNLRFFRHASPLLLSVGLGMFLYLLARSRGG